MLATLSTGTTGIIRTIPADQLEEASNLLALAFMDYPVMRYCFADQEHYYERAVRAYFRFNCERRAATGGVHLGVYEEGALVGIAGIAPTGEAPMPAKFQSRWGWFEALIGPQAAARIERFSQLTEQRRLPALYLSLSVLGVLPEAQGRGHGRALLDATHALAETHPFTDGVYLDTETAANVALFQQLGYRVVSREHLDDLTIWCMFRPNGGGR